MKTKTTNALQSKRGRMWMLLLPMLFLSMAVNAQHVLTGFVLDENNDPLANASVMIKGSERRAATDLDGKFILEVQSPADTILITYVGYYPIEVPVGTSRERTFTMTIDEEQAKLEEVTVVGFGTQKKVSVTGAISTVAVKELAKASTPSLSNSLGGRLPGIMTRQSSAEPGSDQAQIFIRGLGTWGNRAPMILIDGVERSLDNVNVHEIETFSVLKDASATAVYGVRGANGVIVITTKKGVMGRPRVAFRSETALLQPIRLPDYISGAEYASLMNEGLEHVGQRPRWSDEQIELFRNGSDPYLYPNVNWTDEIMRKSTYQTINNLNVSGGGEIIRYYANAGYTDQNGIWKNDPANAYKTNVRMRRYNLRSNVDVNVTEDLIFELGIAGIIQQGDFPATGSDALLDAIRVTPPIAYSARNPDGSPGGTPTLIGNNPWGLATQAGYSVHMHSNVQGTFSAKWDLSSVVTPGMSVSGRFSYDHHYSGGINRHKSFEVKYYTGKDEDTGEDQYTLLREEQPMNYWLWNNSNRAIYSDFIVNYEKSLGDHNLSGMVLYNQRDFINITAGSSIDGLPHRRQGIAARATYGFKDTYFAEFNMGYNGSENFPKGQRFGFFPSISGGWVLSNERFMQSLDFLNSFKIRGSYGQVGNDQIGGRRFLYLTSMNARTAQGYLFGDQQTGWAGIDEMQLGTNDVTWEVSTKSNVGFDMNLLNMITLQVDAFHERRDGILIQRRTIPNVTGFNPSSIPYGNIGVATNRGIEGMAEVKKTTDNGLFLSFMGNFTFARSRIEENDEPVQRWEYQSAKGHPIDQPFGLVALGFFESNEEIANSPRQMFQDVVRIGDIKYKDVNEDGVVDNFDAVPIGYPRTPEMMYGFGGTVAYKGLDISLFFNGASRSSLYLNGPSIMPFLKGQGSYNILREFYDNRWTPENAANAKYPAATDDINPNNYRFSTIYQLDASYLRLRNAEIGYTFPSESSQKIGIQQLRLFVNGMNLATWDKVKVIDPESNDGVGSYPIQRTLNFGIQVNFN